MSITKCSPFILWGYEAFSGEVEIDGQTALPLLDQARLGFADRGLDLDAALCALELAVLYARAGWWGEVERLTAEMVPVFTSRQIPREAAASVLLFARAALDGRATLALVTAAVDALRRAAAMLPPAGG